MDHSRTTTNACQPDERLLVPFFGRIISGNLRGSLFLPGSFATVESWRRWPEREEPYMKFSHISMIVRDPEGNIIELEQR